MCTERSSLKSPGHRASRTVLHSVEQNEHLYLRRPTKLRYYDTAEMMIIMVRIVIMSASFSANRARSLVLNQLQIPELKTGSYKNCVQIVYMIVEVESSLAKDSLVKRSYMHRTPWTPCHIASRRDLIPRLDAS